MKLAERVKKTKVYAPADLGAYAFYRVDQSADTARRDVKVILISVETRDEILRLLNKRKRK